jgi:hypothetical protein
MLTPISMNLMPDPATRSTTVRVREPRHVSSAPQRGTDMNGNTPKAILNHDELAYTKFRSNLDSEGVK